VAAPESNMFGQVRIHESEPYQRQPIMDDVWSSYDLTSGPNSFDTPVIVRYSPEHASVMQDAMSYLTYSAVVSESGLCGYRTFVTTEAITPDVDPVSSPLNYLFRGQKVESGEILYNPDQNTLVTCHERSALPEGLPGCTTAVQLSDFSVFFVIPRSELCSMPSIKQQIVLELYERYPQLMR